MLSRSPESGAARLGIITGAVGLLAAAVTVYGFFIYQTAGQDILAKRLSLKAVNHGQAERFTEFIFENEKGGRLSQSVKLDVTLDLDKDIVRAVNTDPEQKDQKPFVQLATTQCPRADGHMGRVSFFIYGLDRTTSRNELAINNRRVYLRGLYDVTIIRDRESEPTFCWADLEAVED